MALNKTNANLDEKNKDLIAEQKRTEEQKKLAEEHAQKEQVQRKIADERRVEAEEARKNEEEQRKLAESRKTEADVSREKEIEQRKLAVANEMKAKEQTHQAEFELAKGTVSVADAYLLENRWFDAENAYNNAYDKLALLHEPTMYVELALLRYYKNFQNPFWMPPVPALEKFTCQAISMQGGVAVYGKPCERPGTCELKVVDLRTKKEIHIFPEEAHLTRNSAVKFSDDGLLFFTNEIDGIAVWNIKDKRQIRKFISDDKFFIAENFSPDDTSLIVGKYQISHRDLHLLSIENGKELQQFNQIDIGSSFNFSPNGKYGLTRTNQAIAIWDLSTGLQMKIIPTTETRYSLQCLYSPDGKLIYGWDGNAICAWDAFSGQEKINSRGSKLEFLLPKPTVACTNIAVSPDGGRIALGFHDSQLHDAIFVWNARTGEKIATLPSAIFLSDIEFS